MDQKEVKQNYLKAIEGNIQAIDALFETDQLGDKDIQKILDFDIELNPTFDAYQIYLNKKLLEYQPLMIVQNACQLFCGLIQLRAKPKLYSVFLRFYYSNQLKADIQTQVSNTYFDRLYQKQLVKYWNAIHQDKISEFITVFQLQELIEKNQIHEYISNQIQNLNQIQNDQYRYERIFRLIMVLNADKQLLKELIKQMPIRDMASKIADYIINGELDQSEFVEVRNQLRINTVRYFAKTFCWQKIEDLFGDHPELLLTYVQICKEPFQIKYSIAQRCNLIQLMDPQQQQQYQNGPNILENKFFTEDRFTYSEKILDNKNNEFIDFSDFGITIKDIIYLDQENIRSQLAFEQILASDMTGLDTEGDGDNFKSRLDKSERDVRKGLLQISTINQIYIIDVYYFKQSQQYKEFMTQYLQNNNKIIGLNIKNDLQTVCNWARLDSKIINMNKVIELQTIYKQYKKDDPKSSLAHLTQQIFNKPLSKLDTISDWSKRPLRQAQLHYAALDAFICIQLYKKLMELNKQIIVDRNNDI
ncbi:hypothetical protein pb186bvf_017561 [Paramecium bursaria]